MTSRRFVEGDFVITLEDGKGYVIRNSNVGAVTWTVGFDGSIRVGSSSTIGYTIDELNAFIAQVNRGVSFMKKYEGSDTFYDIPKASKIRAKDIVFPALYEDVKGRGILILGKGSYFSHTVNGKVYCDNRGGCYCLRVTASRLENIRKAYYDRSNSELVVECDKWGHVDSYVDHPKGLVRLVSRIDVDHGRFQLRLVRGGERDSVYWVELKSGLG